MGFNSGFKGLTPFGWFNLQFLKTITSYGNIIFDLRLFHLSHIFHQECSTTMAVCTLREENRLLETGHVSVLRGNSERSTQLGPLSPMCDPSYHLPHWTYHIPQHPPDYHKHKPVFTAPPQQKELASSKIPDLNKPSFDTAFEVPRTATLTTAIFWDVMRSNMIHLPCVA